MSLIAKLLLDMPEIQLLIEASSDPIGLMDSILLVDHDSIERLIALEI